MQRRLTFVALLGTVTFISSVFSQAQMQIYGSWHCGNDFCTWASVRDMTDFDFKNHWLIDRGDGSGLASVNLVILSFVQPMKLLNKTNDSGDVNGVPVGMNAAVVNYFTSHNVRVMLSIGGITYTTFWDQALSSNPTQLGLNAAAVAQSNWQQHITGKANYAPPVPPLAPNRLTGSLYIVTGKNPAPECNNFSSSLENSTGNYVLTVPPAGAGTTNGMLGFMFWAAECQGTHSICTTPPNTCEAGVGVGAKTYTIPLPMPPLRQQ